MNNTITISASRSYEVLVDKGILPKVGEYVKKLGNPSTAVLVVGDIVRGLYADTVIKSVEEQGIRVLTYVIPHGEQSKNGKQLFELLEFMAENGVSRTDMMIALGGGVTGDLTGFASAIFLRGINYIQVPTTLLAAVDSSVGGKTAVDLGAGKNLAGAFHQPLMVLCDTDTLNTLPEEEFSAGMGEVIKYGVMCDPELFSFLETNDIREKIQEVILRCVAIKRDVVNADEFDTGARQVLNLGHTLAHGIEKCSSFGIKHGHAVAIGMTAVAKCAYIAKMTEENNEPRIVALCQRCGIPLACDYSPEELVAEISKDKKRAGSKITLVIPKTIGETFLQKMDLSEAETFFMHMNDKI